MSETADDVFQDIFQEEEFLSELLTNDMELEEVSETFGEFNPTSQNARAFRSVNVEEFLAENENKGTKKKTLSDMKLLKTFFFSVNETRDAEFIPPNELNNLLCQFLLAVTKKDGSEYEPTSLRGIVSSLERYLKQKQSRVEIMKDIEFAKSREVLRMKMKHLKKLGLGNKPKTATMLTDTHLEKMYGSGTLGDKSPRALSHSMWLTVTSHFGLRTGKEVHSLQWGDVTLCLDSDTGEEFIMLNTERQTKTRTGTDPKDTRLVKPRAYANPGNPERDPVHLFKTYRDKRPQDMLDADSPFFLSANLSGASSKWYKKTPMGINKIDSIMNEMKVDSGIDDARITPYSAMEEKVDEDAVERKVFNDPIHGHIALHPLCVKIIDTPQFQRLRFLKQLGNCYFVYPGASHNRFEHSIGVSYLAGQLVRALQKGQPSLKIEEKDVLCVEIAGLCHDLGHGPFSHLFDKKFIPKTRPDPKWEHEDASREMFYEILKDNNVNEIFKKYELDETDKKFIVELVTGPRSNANSWPYEGRDKHKSFLYEIVANKNTEIDVDKWDYFARDCHMLGIKNNFDHNRCIQFARVIEVGGKKQICFRDKEVYNLYEMFHTRNTLHRRAYQHQVTTIIDIMVVEAMMLADDHITFPGKDGKPVKMSESIYDMEAFRHLTDNVFFRILDSTGTHKDLVEAREILGNILNRKLYKCVGKTQLKPEQFILKENEDKAKDEIFDKIHQDERARSHLEKEDVIFHVAHFDYGRKEENPIKYVRFYSKNKPNVAFSIRKDEVSQMLPDIFSEQQIVIFCKKKDEIYQKMVWRAFCAWCVEKDYPLSKEMV